MVGRGESPKDIRDNLINTASNPDDDPLLGAGIVQADAAVQRSTRFEAPLNVLFVLLILGGVTFAIVAGNVIATRRFVAHGEGR